MSDHIKPIFNFENKLREVGPSYSFKTSARDSGFFESLKDQTLEFYDAGENTLVREKNITRGSRMIQSNRPRQPYTVEWSRYYILDGDELVGDEEEIKSIIKDNFDVEFSSLRTEPEPRRSFFGSAGRTHFVKDFNYTDCFQDDKKDDLFDELYERTQQKDESQEFHKIKIKLERVARSFGFPDVETLIRNIEFIYSKSSELAKSYEEGMDAKYETWRDMLEEEGVRLVHFDI